MNKIKFKISNILILILKDHRSTNYISPTDEIYFF